MGTNALKFSFWLAARKFPKDIEMTRKIWWNERKTIRRCRKAIEKPWMLEQNITNYDHQNMHNNVSKAAIHVTNEGDVKIAKLHLSDVQMHILSTACTSEPGKPEGVSSHPPTRTPPSVWLRQPRFTVVYPETSIDWLNYHEETRKSSLPYLKLIKICTNHRRWILPYSNTVHDIYLCSMDDYPNNYDIQEVLLLKNWKNSRCVAEI